LLARIDVVRFGGIPPLIAALQKHVEEDEKVAVAACDALDSITGGGPDSAAAVFAAGLIPALATALLQRDASPTFWDGCHTRNGDDGALLP